MTIPISNINATFANSTIRYDAIGMNVNASAYAENSNILHLKSNDDTKFYVDVAGNTKVNGSLTVANTLIVEQSILILSNTSSNIFIANTILTDIGVANTTNSVNLNSTILISGSVNSNTINSNALTANVISSNVFTANTIDVRTISANVVSSNVITANIFTANIISANVVTSNVITTNTITVNTNSANTTRSNTITANVISSNVFTANTIDVRTISANVVSSNVITANIFTANSITNNVLASNAITSNSITANTIISGIYNVVAGSKASQFEVVIDGGGAAVTTGIKGDLRVPFNCTLRSWSIVSDVAGSIVVDVWRTNYANYPPVAINTIAGTAKPTLSAAVKANNTTLVGWTSTSLFKDDYLRFNVDSAVTVSRVTLSFEVEKT